MIDEHSEENDVLIFVAGEKAYLSIKVSFMPTVIRIKWPLNLTCDKCFLVAQRLMTSTLLTTRTIELPNQYNVI